MNYDQRLRKVIDYIGQHLDEELSLERLSDVFGISKFHFHRLFTAFTGMSLQQYIRWLRLKRAAHQLIVDKDLPIINIVILPSIYGHLTKRVKSESEVENARKELSQAA